MIHPASPHGVDPGRSWPFWTQQPQTRAAQPAILSGEALQGLWHQKQCRNVTELSLTSVSSHPPVFPVPFIQLSARGV